MIATHPNIQVAGIRLRSVVGMWFRHMLVFRRTWWTAMTWYLIEPGVILLAIGLGVGQLVDDVEGVTYAQFVTPGVIAGSAMFHSVFECAWGSFFRIQKGAYETILTAPVTVREIALGDLSWAMSRSIITSVAIGTIASALGWIDSIYGVGILVAAVLVGMVFGSIGLIFAAVCRNPHTLSLSFTIVATPLYFFSGSFFPISVLPDWLEPIAWAAPLTPAVHLARGFVNAQLDLTHLYAAAYLIGLTALIFPIAAFLMRRRLVK